MDGSTAEHQRRRDWRGHLSPDSRIWSCLNQVPPRRKVDDPTAGAIAATRAGPTAGGLAGPAEGSSPPALAPAPATHLEPPPDQASASRRPSEAARSKATPGTPSSSRR